MNWKRKAPLILLMICLTVPLCAELLTPEEVDYLIGSEDCYSAEEVKSLVMEMVAVADEEIVRTAEKAVKEAVIPLQVEIYTLQEEAAERGRWIFYAAGIGVVVGFVLGVML